NYFFFSSRRRHTRCLSDWSSDVCSSDLTAERETVLTQHLDVLEERKGPRRRDLFDERLFRDAQRARLMPQQRMVVADAVGDLEMIGGVNRDALVAARQRDRTHDLQKLAVLLLPLHAGFLKQVDERRGAAIHDRHFRR